MKNEKGFTLIEVMIGMALIGVIVVALLTALQTASLALFTADKRATAESLARSQIEFIKESPYDDANDPPQYTGIYVTPLPSGYSITTTAERLDPKGDGTGNDDGIQKITVAVNLGGNVISLQDYKVKR